MEIRLLNSSYEIIALLDLFSSLIWHRKYYSCGNFELHASKRNFEVFRDVCYVSIEGFQETGIVESTGYSSDKNTAYIKGRFAESLLSNFVVNQMQNLSGTPAQINKKLVELFCPPVQTLPAELPGKSVELQTTGDNLMEKCYEIAKSQQQSTRVDFDFLKNSWSFATWQGLDRTENQTENSQVIFSDDFENVMSASYERNKQEHKNFAYVAGEGEGNARTVITVDQTGGTPRCELWVDARDMQKGELSDADYRAQLTQRGTEKLAEYTIVEKAAMTATQDTNLIYKTDYDLGDRCTYLDSQNAIEFEQRITEVVETYENNAVSIQITFGDEHKTMLQKVKRSTS